MNLLEWRVLLCERLYQGSNPLGNPSLWETVFITLGIHCTFPLETLCTFYRVSKHLRRLSLKRIPVRSIRVEPDFNDPGDRDLKLFLLEKTLIVADEYTLTLLPGRKCASQNEAIFVDFSALMRYTRDVGEWKVTDLRTKNLLVALTRVPPSKVTRRVVAVGLTWAMRATLVTKVRAWHQERYASKDKCLEKRLCTWRHNEFQTDTMDPQWRALFAYRTLSTALGILERVPFSGWEAMKPHKKRASEVEQLKRDQSPKRK